MEQDKKTTKFGTITGIIIVIIILIIGIFYFAEQRIEKQKEFQENITQNQEEIIASDEISDIENDASLTNLDELGEGIDEL